MARRYLDNAGMPDTTYNVVRGDTLWDIANQHGISLDELRSLNPNLKGDIIHPNDVINIAPEYEERLVDLRKERALEEIYNRDNLSAIQGAYHDRNYVVLDKPNGTLTVYDKENNPIFSTKDISIGLSGQDYNTVTYSDGQGNLKNYAGNNSTPAGISVIRAVGDYEGHPTFIRAKVNSKGELEDIPSSMHYFGDRSKKNLSNGCVRLSGKDADILGTLIGPGTNVYSLPEQKGSRFSLKGGRTHFTADNPYGINEGPTRFEDDYNIHVDKTYSPLQLKWNKTGNKEFDKNVKQYAQSLVNNKQKIQKQFGLTSDEYNRFAEMALGLAAQETKFGTSRRYNLKEIAGDAIIGLLKTIRDGKAGSRSRGLTQIKLGADNEAMQSLYNTLGITNDNINNPDISALATVARLAQMYNTEVRGRTFTGESDEVISPYDALLYKWNGHNEQLINHTATPNKNKYLKSVKGYANNFRMFERRKYRK